MHIRDCTLFKRLPFKLDEEQWKFVEAVWNKDNIGVFCNACAGSSKTTLATAMALLMTAEFKMYESIHYIVSPCQESTLGFFFFFLDDKITYYFVLFFGRFDISKETRILREFQIDLTSMPKTDNFTIIMTTT